MLVCFDPDNHRLKTSGPEVSYPSSQLIPKISPEGTCPFQPKTRGNAVFSSCSELVQRHLSLTCASPPFCGAGGAQPLQPEPGPGAGGFPKEPESPWYWEMFSWPCPLSELLHSHPALWVRTQGCLHQHLWQPLLTTNLSWHFITSYHLILQNWELFPQFSQASLGLTVLEAGEHRKLGRWRTISYKNSKKVTGEKVKRHKVRPDFWETLLAFSLPQRS